MDLKVIKELAKLMEDRSLSSLEIVDQDLQIRMNRVPKEIIVPAEQKAIPMVPAEPVVVPQKVGAEQPSEKLDESLPSDTSSLTELKSPMVGTVYLAPAPGEKTFVKTGDVVKKGQVLCIIEAMKLMNEYTAPQDGEIADICVKDGQLTEYGQCLFKFIER